ncbi:MAG: S8 family serine peptidase [Proteobacteria bacterium]|jgi:hypothetical protein|nr:S8 family serine peptidase [Pseudomonadota bacterium]
MFAKNPFARISIVTKVAAKMVALAVALIVQNVAHAQVADGTIVVGLIDTGVNTSGNNLNVIFELGTDFLLNNGSFFDSTSISHGTTSALIIDEQSSGVAIAPLKVTNGNFFTTKTATDAAILTAAQNSNIRVLSVSEGFKGFSDTMGAASDAGKFISIQSGNGFSAEPNAMASAHFVLPGVVIVGGADGGGGLLPQSNRAGVTAERYVVSPGVTGFSPIFGTSFAAARIAGIGAAVLLQNPQLTGEDVAQVIFASAEDRGEPGVDVEWGQGFVLDAAQVLNSIVGPPTIPTIDQASSGTGGSGGGGSSAAAGGLVLGAVVGGIILLSKGGSDKLEKTLIMDSYGRPFEVDLRDHVTVADHASNVGSFFNSLDEQYGAVRVYTGFENSFIDISYSTFGSEAFEFNRFAAIAGDVVWADHQNTDVSFSFAGGQSDGLNYRINHNTNPHTQFASVTDDGTRGMMSQAVFLSGQTFASPALGFSSRANSASITYPLTEDISLQMGAVSVEENQNFGLDSSSTLLQLEYRLGERGAVDFQFAQLDENQSLFGGSNGGAFGVEQSETWAVNITGHYRLSDRVSLVGNLGQGLSSIDDAKESLLHNFSQVRSEWFGFGLLANNVFSEGDRVGIAWSQPMRITNGEVDYTVPYALDAERKVLKNIDRISLVSDGAERKLEAYYRFPLGESAELGSFLMMRSEPNHVRGAKTNYSAMVTLRLFM